MKEQRYCVVERTQFGYEKICGYGFKQNFFVTREQAKELYDLVESVRGNKTEFKSQFAIMKLLGEHNFQKSRIGGTK